MKTESVPCTPPSERHAGFENAAGCGFSPDADAAANVRALQFACDGGHKTLVVTQPGVYRLNDTVYLDDRTRLVFGEGVTLEKTGRYSFVFINRGALDRTWNHDISLDGLEIRVNGVDCLPSYDHPCYGLRGHLSLFGVRNAAITRFRCLDLARPQFTIHVCAFENLLIDGFEIRGMKDGVHVGAGRGFVIRNGLCQTFDDAVALNAQDYPSAQPMQGDIEDGIIENVTDLSKDETSGNFARLLTGAWVDWHEGIRLQNGDTVRHGRNVYRIVMEHGITEYVSREAPVHTRGAWMDTNGLRFVYNQNDAATQANIRNVTFANITLRDKRTGFAAHWETGGYHRAIHPETATENFPACDVSLRDISGIASPALIVSNSHLRVWLDRVYTGGTIFSGGGRGVKCALVATGLRMAADAVADEPDIRFADDGTLDLVIEGTLQERDLHLDLDAAARVRVNGTASIDRTDTLTPRAGDSIRVRGIPTTYDGNAWR